MGVRRLLGFEYQFKDLTSKVACLIHVLSLNGGGLAGRKAGKCLRGREEALSMAFSVPNIAILSRHWLILFSHLRYNWAVRNSLLL